MENHWLYSTLPWDEPQYKCLECDKPMHKKNEYCSNDCWEASNL